MRLQDRPVHRGSAAVHFPDLATGAEAVRALSQAALFPTNCRLLDPGEAAGSAGTTDGSAVLVLGFESAHHQVEPWLEVALEECRDHGGVLPALPRYRADTGPARETADAGSGAVEAWRNAFLRAPYGRDALVTMSVIAETFETACTWEDFGALHEGVTRAVTDAVDEICGGGTISCRFTHVYPDGPAPYFTVMAPSRWGSELTQWAEIKAAASEAGRLVKVGFNHRFHPAIADLASAVHSGEHGELMHVRARYGHGGRIGYDREWRAQPRRSGGGELIDQGMHLLDIVHWLAGPLPLHSALLRTHFWDTPVEDNAALILGEADTRTGPWRSPKPTGIQ